MQYLANISEKTFSSTVWTVMQVLIQKRTYYCDDFMTASEAARIRFRVSGIPDGITQAHQKMFIINTFILKTLLPDVFCQPEQHLSEFLVSSQSRL